MDLPVFPVLTAELDIGVPRDKDHKSSKFDDGFGGAAGEAFEDAIAGVVGRADIDGRAEVVGDSGVEVDHMLPDDPLPRGEKVCLFVGENAPMEVLANAAGVTDLGTCAVKGGLIMGARLATGGLVLRSISISVGLVARGGGADVGAGDDGAA